MLNAGAGLTVAKRIQPLLTSPEWEEIRLDVDADVDPDIVGSITDLSELFPPASFDAIWCSHLMEHLYAHEIHPTFVQFREVLKPDGFALIMSPDLEAVAQHMLTQGLGAIAYVSAAGPIRPLDMIYGHSGAIEQGRHHMAHKTGFSTDRMGNLLLSAGFPTVSVRSGNFEICALALMPEADDGRIRPLLEACGFDFRETVSAA
ncbi:MULTISPECIES: class I SAM-dependent methyltransferase [unclassified Bradyrhizobium]|uniref:class I SAM-dependent methyltransferase n=1 Tax=unclassified Bradyrhizobium TaxID=2631580 RepID=UPI00048ADD19|nr:MULTISPECIES: class I SAM-dependent methyltransferase [unclassified Bradyrhizobium]QIG99801.1 class I SAM-dependent methyltransferase [Bradyrhizobium sp. 6(2017)]